MGWWWENKTLKYSRWWRFMSLSNIAARRVGLDATMLLLLWIYDRQQSDFLIIKRPGERQQQKQFQWKMQFAAMSQWKNFQFNDRAATMSWKLEADSDVHWSIGHIYLSMHHHHHPNTSTIHMHRWSKIIKIFSNNDINNTRSRGIVERGGKKSEKTTILNNLNSIDRGVHTHHKRNIAAAWVMEKKETKEETWKFSVVSLLTLCIWYFNFHCRWLEVIETYRATLDLVICGLTCGAHTLPWNAIRLMKFYFLVRK